MHHMKNILYINVNGFAQLELSQCTQELKLIKERCAVVGESARTIKQKKFWTKITCNTEKSFHIDTGSIVKIGCVTKLWKKVSPNTTIMLQHPPVEGSVEGCDANGNFLLSIMDEDEIVVPDNVEFLSFRPWLDILLTSIDNTQSRLVIEGEEV